MIRWGGGLHFGSKRRLNVSINLRKLSIFYWPFLNRSETLGGMMKNFVTNSTAHFVMTVFSVLTDLGGSLAMV